MTAGGSSGMGWLSRHPILDRDQIGEAAIFQKPFHLGIAPADREKIFDRFVRVAPIQHYGGLGLGLYIVRHVVEAHGGTISVDSTPGEGALFTVELPLA